MTDTTSSAPASSYRADKLEDVPLRAPDKVEAPSAKLRLEASRARIGSALLEISHPPKRSNSGLVDKLMGMVENIPGVTLVVDTAKSWWHEHRETAQTAGQASQALVTPIAQRHPQSLVGAAAAFGALLVLLRPWRLLLRRKVVFGAASLVASQAMRSRSPGEWLQMLTKPASRKART